MDDEPKISCRWGLYTLIVLVCCLPIAARAAPVVTDIRIGVKADVTRILFEFTRETKAQVFLLADPYRVVIDLPEVGWRLPPRPLPAASGVYAKLRYGLYKPGNSRVVLDLLSPAQIRKASLLRPDAIYGYRLAIELAPTSREDFLEAKQYGPISVSSHSENFDSADARRTLRMAELPEALRPKRSIARSKIVPKNSEMAGHIRYPLAPRKPELRRNKPSHSVVLDPGHGGVDPGAVGVSGSYEKHIALSMARAIRNALKEYGIFEVSLTRDRDIFVPLRDRIGIARKKGADLFISIHADATKNQKIHGPSVYTLSEKASDKEAAALAEKENKADLIAGIDLSNNSDEVANILIDLAQRAAMNQSVRFANLLVSHLKQRTKVLRKPHRFAGFAVLKAPDIPSVLLELGFLSNARDERALRTRAYRKKIAVGVAKAVNSYFQKVEQASRR